MIRESHGGINQIPRGNHPQLIQLIRIVPTSETQPLQHTFSGACPTRQLLDQIANKWSVLIMLALQSQPVRFNDLKRRLEGISQKVLGETLKTLERNGLVERTVLDAKPISVEYRITDHGRGLTEIVEQLRGWSIDTLPHTQKAQAEYDARVALAAAAEKRVYRA